MSTPASPTGPASGPTPGSAPSSPSSSGPPSNRGVSEPTARLVRGLERPESQLLTYYAITSLALGPFFFFALIPLFFRYRTLRYRFEDEGVSMRWGILFRREIHLTYSRIQDIHLTSNVLERWLGLARIQIQTASGSSKAEMVIEGLAETEAIRDFLYARMRGMGDDSRRRSDRPSTPAAPGVDASAAEDLATALAAVTRELAAVRRALEADDAPATPPVDPGSPS